MRRAAKVDTTQRQIVATFRQLGCSVVDLSRVGCGVPDLIVARNGTTWLIECKTGKGKLNALQRDFAQSWAGHIEVCRTSADAARCAMEMGR